MEIKPYNETVEIIQDKYEFYLKPSNPRFASFPSVTVPKMLFENYLIHRELKKRLKSYFEPVVLEENKIYKI